MNLILIEPHELAGGCVTISGRRARHIALVHRAVPGKSLRIGVLGGAIGTGVVAHADVKSVMLEHVQLPEPPPAPLPCTLVLALPRPKVLRRVLAAIAAFGIKRVVIIGAQRVEKSYWQSPMLADDAMREELLNGLEQGCDTILPVIEMRRRFRPFVEDELAGLSAGSLSLVAHPGGDHACPRARGAAVTLVVGPEGGFVDFELELLRASGFACVHLGTRPLRVEHALAALIGRLF